MGMDWWPVLGAIVAAVSAVVTAVNVWLVLQIKLAIANLRLDIEKMRGEDRVYHAQEYLPREVADGRFHDLERRIEELEAGA